MPKDRLTNHTIKMAPSGHVDMSVTQVPREDLLKKLPVGLCCGQYVNFSLHENIWIFTKTTLLYKDIYTTSKGATLHQWYY